MFFIGIFGVHDKKKLCNEFSNIVCKCGALSRAEFFEKYRYFHVFFIPVVKWNKEYIVRMRCCMKHFKATNEYAFELKRSMDIDMNRLEEIEAGCKGSIRDVCVHCKERIHPSFSYCPYCGNRIG